MPKRCHKWTRQFCLSVKVDKKTTQPVSLPGGENPSPFPGEKYFMCDSAAACVQVCHTCFAAALLPPINSTAPLPCITEKSSLFAASYISHSIPSVTCQDRDT